MIFLLRFWQRAFQNSAEMVCKYRVLSTVDEGIDYRGEVILSNRAVRLLSCVADMTGDERVRTVQNKELWLFRRYEILCGVLYFYNYNGQRRSNLPE